MRVLRSQKSGYSSAKLSPNSALFYSVPLVQKSEVVLGLIGWILSCNSLPGHSLEMVYKF